MKSSKAQIFAKFHKIPTIRFEDQELTSFSGMILFQLLFKSLNTINTRRSSPTKPNRQKQSYCFMMAHNLSREMQMVASPAKTYARPKRPAGWTFKRLDTIRHQILQRAGRFIKLQGKLTLVMSGNPAVKKDLVHRLDKLFGAA